MSPTALMKSSVESILVNDWNLLEIQVMQRIGSVALDPSQRRDDLIITVREALGDVLGFNHRFQSVMNTDQPPSNFVDVASYLSEMMAIMMDYLPEYDNDNHDT